MPDFASTSLADVVRLSERLLSCVASLSMRAVVPRLTALAGLGAVPAVAPSDAASVLSGLVALALFKLLKKLAICVCDATAISAYAMEASADDTASWVAAMLPNIS